MMYFWIINGILLNTVIHSYCEQYIDDDYKELNERMLFDWLPPLNLSWFESSITGLPVIRNKDRDKFIQSIQKSRPYSYLFSYSQNQASQDQDGLVRPKSKSPKKRNMKKKVNKIITTKEQIKIENDEDEYGKRRSNNNDTKFQWNEKFASWRNRSPVPLQLDVTVKESPQKDVLVHVQMKGNNGE